MWSWSYEIMAINFISKIWFDSSFKMVTDFNVQILYSEPSFENDETIDHLSESFVVPIGIQRYIQNE